MHINNITITNKDKERFFKYVYPEPNTGCWLWLGTTRGHMNYGHFTIKSRTHISAHRFSWLIHWGEIKDNLFVCHRCDFPVCVNPQHLFLGTRKQNMEDMALKNRSQFGEKCALSKLTENEIIKIRSLYNGNHGDKTKISELLGIPHSTICDIINNKTWKRVKRPPKDL